MTYLVTESCIKCKFMDCVEVCPVDCFYEGENMLVIHPDECIDCGVCEPECPVEAIIPDTGGDDNSDKWLEINTKFAESWPNITREGDPPAAGRQPQAATQRRSSAASAAAKSLQCARESPIQRLMFLATCGSFESGMMRESWIIS